MQKKIPQRQCMGCRERKAKRELIRVVRSPEGEVSLDFSGKKNGRGAYICPNPECLKKAIRSKALDRSLEVTIPEEVYQRLEKEMEGGHA
ncbi:MAG: YlxR family protein [Firmicutes bacterium]|nr:YlxR family protein [Bacillota bacterium]